MIKLKSIVFFLLKPLLIFVFVCIGITAAVRAAISRSVKFQTFDHFLEAGFLVLTGDHASLKYINQNLPSVTKFVSSRKGKKL